MNWIAEMRQNVRMIERESNEMQPLKWSAVLVSHVFRSQWLNRFFDLKTPPAKIILKSNNFGEWAELFQYLSMQRKI